MDNQNNTVLTTIYQRRSIGKLVLPVTNDDELAAAFQAAFAAPDHKQLKPWKFTVLTGQALIEFGRVLLQAEEVNAPADALDDTARQKLLNMPMRAPMIITVATDIKEHEKVPPFEQLLSAGAAIQNLLLALESLGYHTVWRTGPLCNEPVVKAHFDVADKDTICGFVYVGSSDVQMPVRESIDINDFVSFCD